VPYVLGSNVFVGGSGLYGHKTSEFAEKLAQEIKWTSSSRFIAEHRLLSAEKRSNYSIALSSAFVIVYTILPLTLKISPEYVAAVNAAAIIMSILLLAVSLLHVKNDYGSRALMMRWSALELNALRKEIQAAVSVGLIPVIQLNEFVRRREHILAKFDLNHENEDFETYKLRTPWEFTDLLAGLDASSQGDLIKKRTRNIMIRKIYLTAKSLSSFCLIGVLYAIYACGVLFLLRLHFFSP
jgi:uncharacterized membrane protein (DUF485 family)